MDTAKNAAPAIKQNDLIERLTIPGCEPTFDEEREVHRFLCGMTVSDALTKVNIDRKAVREARAVHYQHHQNRHEPHGDEWAIQLQKHESQRGTTSYQGSCPLATGGQRRGRGGTA